jgi:putative two-component system response regulator
MAGQNDRQRVLIVDDEEKNLRLISTIMKNSGYSCDVAKNGKEALEKTGTFDPDIIFLDIMMPEMDGYQVCKLLKDNPKTQHIPVVMITALEGKDSRIRGLEAGANDFLTKPIDNTELMVRAKNLLKVKEFEDFLKQHNERLESEVAKRTGQLKLALQELSKSQDELKIGYLDTIYRLTIVAEYKDEETSAHIKRVGLYCAHTARVLGWSTDRVETIQYAAPMHDIGKIGIPSDILLKPSALTPEEYALAKTHTTIGARILSGSRSALLQMAERIALTHHERWDGTGYPRGLRGEDVPLEARIMNIADQYDSLRSKRPYKPAYDYVKAFRVITQGDGRTLPAHFDPKLLEVFKDTSKAFEEIYSGFES